MGSKHSNQKQSKKNRLALKFLFVLILPAGAILGAGFFLFAPQRLPVSVVSPISPISPIPEASPISPASPASAVEANPVLGKILFLRQAVFNKLCPHFSATFCEEASPFSDIERIKLVTDKNNNGIFDLDEFVLGARQEAKQKTIYRSAYYQGGYPPEAEGVCSDVIWRAMKAGGYNLKELVDADIKANLSAYPRVRQGGGKPDPNIDFRRVPNLDVFFRRHGTTLANEIIPGDRENLKLWQAGDIVIFYDPDHIAIVSDQRNYQGVPLLIHNDGPWASEADDLLMWKNLSKVIKHYRYPMQE